MGRLVFGIRYYDDVFGDGSAVKRYKIISSGTPGVEYQIQMEPEEREGYIIQEFSENSSIEIEAVTGESVQ